jgi:hypothetical protein
MPKMIQSVHNSFLPIITQVADLLFEVLDVDLYGFFRILCGLLKVLDVIYFFFLPYFVGTFSENFCMEFF